MKNIVIQNRDTGEEESLDAAIAWTTGPTVDGTPEHLIINTKARRRTFSKPRLVDLSVLSVTLEAYGTIESGSPSKIHSYRIVILS